MIVEKFKVNQNEADLDILRQEKSIPADFDPMKLVDFSFLPGGR
jgi:hypothetical protein